MAKKALVLSVEKALKIIELFRETPKLNLTEIANILDMPKSTAFGLIATLEKYGYLEQEETTGKYQLGITLLEMGGIFSSRLDIKDEVLPVIKMISERFAGNVHLTKLLGNEVVYIENIEPTNTVVIRTRIGSRAPANCTSTGKAFLACLSEEEIDKLFLQEQLPILTQNSINDIETLKDHLSEIRRLGYSVDREESILGVKGVGAVVKDRAGKPVVGISIAGLSGQMSDEKIKEIGTVLAESSAKLSKRLG